MNQNPILKVTPNSILPDILVSINYLKNNQIYENFPKESSLDNVLKNIFNNYYSDWNSEIIIDRSNWGLPSNFEILKKYSPNEIKIIVLVRDIKEILASYIKWSYSNETNYIAQNGNTLRQRCDYVMANGGSFHIWLQAVFNLCKPENKKYIHLIEYDDLVNNTKNEIDKVYEYLDIPKFDHSFQNLSQLNIDGIEYNDNALGGDLHKIKTDKVEKVKYNIYDYLPKDVDFLYKTKSFWRKECLI